MAKNYILLTITLSQPFYTGYRWRLNLGTAHLVWYPPKKTLEVICSIYSSQKLLLFFWVMITSGKMEDRQ